MPGMSYGERGEGRWIERKVMCMDAVTREILMQADSQMADICMQRRISGSGTPGQKEDVMAEAAAVIRDYLRCFLLR